MIKPFLKSIVAAILQWEARQVLRKYKPYVVAVTGSVGKTSAKDAIYTVLSESTFVRKSEKSFNSELGVPLTILGCPNAWNSAIGWIRNIIDGFVLFIFPHPYPRTLVLEVGADRPGDIQKVAGWLSPDVVVITRIPEVPVHVEFFHSPEEVVEEKSYLPRALKPNGFLILNADDGRSLRFRSAASTPHVITYGFINSATVRAVHERVTLDRGKPTGMSFHIDYDGKSIPITLAGVLGKQPIYAVLSAIATGIACGLSLVDMQQHLALHKGPPGRMRILEGINDSVLIDDSYNSSPVAAEEALRLLASLKVKGKRIAVLGDMLELGRYSVDEHKQIGTIAGGAVDKLIVVGPRSNDIAGAAHKAGLGKRYINSCSTAEEAGEVLKSELEEGDVVLIKGSQGMRLERATERLLKDPQKARELLPRQDNAWRSR